MRVLGVVCLVILAGCSTPSESPEPTQEAPIVAAPEGEETLPEVEGEAGTVPDDPAYRVKNVSHTLYLECQVSVIGMGPYCNNWDDYTKELTVPTGAEVAHVRWATNYSDGLETYFGIYDDGESSGSHIKNFDDEHDIVVDLTNITSMRVGVRAQGLAEMGPFSTGYALEAHATADVTFYLDGVPEHLESMCLQCIVDD